MKFNRIIASSFLAATVLMSCSSDDDSGNGEQNFENILTDPSVVNSALALEEADNLLTSIEEDQGTPFDFENPTVYPPEANVFIPSVLGVDYRLDGNGTTSNQPSVTLPMFQGWEVVDGAPREAYYIITESSDAGMAERLGVIHARRMAEAKGSEGVQLGTFGEDGRLVFTGTVDFGGTRRLTPGVPVTDAVEGDANFGILTFPPATAEAGATADDAWSSYVVLPSGVVINAQMVANETGFHDRIATANTGLTGQDVDNVNFDPDNARVALQLLDGWQGGEQYYFHIVTDTSNDGPSAIEKGVTAARLENIPTFGNFPGGAFLPFSPCANGVPGGITDANGNTLYQGLNVAIDSNNQDQDPTNTFPIDPTDPDYTPMWDAHICQWTVPNEEKVILTSTAQINSLFETGELTNFFDNDTDSTESNTLFPGLSPTGAIINCPVISQPTTEAIGERYGDNLVEL